MRRHLWLTLALTVVLTFGLGGIALAESPEEEPAEKAAVESAEAPMPVYGMQAWIDEETGGFRAPTAGEAAKMSAKLQQIFGKAKFEPKLFQFKNGMLAAEIDPSMFKFSVVRVDEEGHLHTNCVHGAHQALELLETTASTPTLEEK